MANLIEISNVQKVYRTTGGRGVDALRDVSLEVGQGEFVSIVGPSGCGKSTLLKMLAGLVSVSSGSLRVGGDAVTGPRSDLGFVFQQPVLLPWRSVLDNVLFPVQVLRKRRSDYEERAMQLLELVGLKEFAKQYPFELSGGMQQRVAIARALVHKPSTILMDEPFGALDAITRDQMIVELNRLWVSQRPTILFVTHSISEAIFLSTRVVVFSGRPGTIIGSIDIPFGESRSLDLTLTTEFNQLVQQGRHLLAGGGGGTPVAPAQLL